jgi:1-hydroxycarotenoid 3,4-desaturase
MRRRDPTIVVIGAGVAGLTCAVDLAVAGFRVKVLERAARSGGKARVVRVGDASVDAGPTVLTMPWVFDELFHAAGSSFRDAVKLDRASVLARHTWSDGTRLDLHADRARSADAIGEVFGAQEARAYLAFCEDGRKMYEFSEGPFLRAQRPTMGSIVRQFGPVGLTVFARLDGHRSMWRSLQQRFAEPRLRQLFARYATYSGSSPFEAPATLNLIAHVEAEGVYRARGGMHMLVEALEALARSLGVEILHDHGVDRILVERGRASGVVVGDTAHLADAVVFNGDVSALGTQLLGPDAARAAPVTPPDTRSLSAVTWAMLARPVGFPLLHHNLFFSDDYPAEFEALMRHRRAPAEPTVYVCAQDRGDAAIDAAEERLLILVNAPATGDDPAAWNESEKERCTTATLTLLRRAGLTLEPSTVVQTTPADFHRLFPATGGALYGPRSKGALSILSRQAALSKLPGLYLAGGSVHPGAGVPMAALSGRLAAERIRADLASIVRSRPAATTGTTSTE